MSQKQDERNNKADEKLKKSKVTSSNSKIWLKR